MKSFLFALGLVASATAAQAQGGPRSSFGIKAGGTLTTVTGPGRAGSIFGFQAGLLRNFAVNRSFSIQPEVLYSMKGFKATNYETSFGTATSTRMRFHYLDVPVLARVQEGGFFVEAGPQISFAVGADGYLRGTGSGFSEAKRDLKDFVNVVDLGYVGGVGYQPAQGLGIGLRYNGGFLDAVQTVGGRGHKNSGFQLYVAYLFGNP